MTAKVFSKIFVGVRENKLGFMCPYEENKAFEKRKHTIDRWLRQSVGGNWIECVESGRRIYVPNDPKSTEHVLDNLPLEGFKITDDIKRRYWGGGNVVFRVTDPRGFELEISSQNLMMLIEHATLDKGVISGRCIWGRDGAVNVLLHETSEEYASATKAAEKIPRRKPLDEKGLVVGKTYYGSDNERVLLYLGKKKVASFPYWARPNIDPGLPPTRHEGPMHVQEMHLWGYVYTYDKFKPGYAACAKGVLAYAEAPDCGWTPDAWPTSEMSPASKTPLTEAQTAWIATQSSQFGRYTWHRVGYRIIEE